MMGMNPENLADGDSLLDKGIVDSTGILELIGFLEENFDIQIDDEELIPENLDSVVNLINFVNRKKSG
ncbi:MAG: acyl carrier protein [Candidatus Zixiibacteriota bacterium]|nr:MAG: acyl carrier protein [candidate division Zixibacteria bacterium]